MREQEGEQKTPAKQQAEKRRIAFLRFQASVRFDEEDVPLEVSKEQHFSDTIRTASKSFGNAALRRLIKDHKL